MNFIRNVSNNVENRFLTLNKVWDGNLYKKIGVVFFSVLTAGILPLALIVYDTAKNSTQWVMFGGKLINPNQRVIFGRDQYSICLFNRWSFSIPDKLSKNFKAIATSVGVIGTVVVLKKVFNSAGRKALVVTGLIVGSYIFKKSVEHYRYVMNFREAKRQKTLVASKSYLGRMSAASAPSSSGSVYPRLPFRDFNRKPSAPVKSSS